MNQWRYTNLDMHFPLPTQFFQVSRCFWPAVCKKYSFFYSREWCTLSQYDTQNYIDMIPCRDPLLRRRYYWIFSDLSECGVQRALQGSGTQALVKLHSPIWSSNVACSRAYKMNRIACFFILECSGTDAVRGGAERRANVLKVHCL